MIEAFGGAVAAALAIVVWGVVVGLCVWYALSMFLEGAISGLELAVYAGLTMAAAAGVIASAGTALFPVLVLVSFAVPVSLPLMNWLVDRLNLQALRMEDIARHQEAVTRFPGVPDYVKRLADALYEAQEWALAKEYYEQYKKLAGERGIRFRLQRCEEMLARKAGGSRICEHCHGANPRGARICMNCERPLAGAWELMEQLRGPAGRRGLLVAIALATAAALILSLVGRLPAILASLSWLMVVAALFVYVYIRLTSRTRYSG